MEYTPNPETINSESLKNSLLFRHLGCDVGKYVTTIRRLDRQEQTRLRMAIAQGSELDHRGERVSTPATTAPPIDKARLASWLRGEIGSLRDEMKDMIRSEVGTARQELEVLQRELIVEAMQTLVEEGGS